MYHCVLNHGTLKHQLKSNEPGRMTSKFSARVSLVPRPFTSFTMLHAEIEKLVKGPRTRLSLGLS